MAVHVRPWLFGVGLAWACNVSAGGFTEGGAALWSTRVEGIVRAFKDAPDAESAQLAMGHACEGISGEMFKYGMYKTQVPNHASAALRSFCRGIDGLNGGNIGRSSACSEFADARRQFAKIKPEDAPERVVALDGFMLELLDALLQQGEKAGWRGC